jgi:rod shape-determining protein MreC
MAGKLKKPNGLLIASILLGVLVVIINFQHIKRFAYKISSDFLYPFIDAPNSGSKKISDIRLLSKSKEELAMIAERYKKENNKLLAELASIEDLRTENKTLRNLLSVPERPAYKYIFAELIIRDPAFWDEKFTINKGEDDNIKPGSIVLTTVDSKDNTQMSKLAVVGRVVDVTNHTATISTIFSQDCKLSVKLSASNVTGILNGGKREGNLLWANITYLPRDINYAAGEPVYTSGVTSWSPGNLYIGKLMGKSKATIKIQNNLYVKAKLLPEANINNLKFVMIMVKK